MLQQRNDSFIVNSSNISSNQVCSDVNEDVFYVSGKTTDTAGDLNAPCEATSIAASGRYPPPADNNEQTAVMTTTTTFKYFTYDRDYFRERHKSACLQDRDLRHSMH